MLGASDVIRSNTLDLASKEGCQGAAAPSETLEQERRRRGEKHIKKPQLYADMMNDVHLGG